MINRFHIFELIVTFLESKCVFVSLMRRRWSYRCILYRIESALINLKSEGKLVFVSTSGRCIQLIPGRSDSFILFVYVGGWRMCIAYLKVWGEEGDHPHHRCKNVSFTPQKWGQYLYWFILIHFCHCLEGGGGEWAVQTEMYIWTKR